MALCRPRPTPLKAKQLAVLRSCTDIRKSDQGNRFRGANDRTRYDLQIAECKGSRNTKREAEPLTMGPNMKPTGEVLMVAGATVNEKSS